MAQERDALRELGNHDTISQGAGYLFAQRVSRVFHPLILNMLTVILVGYFALETRATGLMWAGICIVAQVVPLTAFFLVRMRQGAYTDEDVSQRHQRNELYAFGIATVLLCAAILIPLGLPRPFIALLIGGFGVAAGGGLINLFWKISVHSASAASAATVALLFSLELGIVLWICALLVGWARIRTRNHTPLQVLGGFTMAALIVLVVFNIVV